MALDTLTAGAAPVRPVGRVVAPFESYRDRLVGPMPTDRLWGWLGPLLVTAFGAVLRFWHLRFPPSTVFDEVYYYCDSHNLLLFGVEHATKPNNPHCVLAAGAGYVVHPPLGKWMIAFGEWVFGWNSFGWRFSAAAVGSLAILIVARTARRLTRSTLLGCVAGLLLACEALEFVQSRAALLDIFVMFWVTAALGCLVADRDRTRLRLAREAAERASGWTGPWTGIRPWRIAAGICLGAACACKWSAVWYIPLFMLLTFVWDAGARRLLGVQRPRRATLLRDVPGSIGAYLGLGLVTYTATWYGWFVGGSNAWGHDTYVVPGQSTVAHMIAVVHGWLSYQNSMWVFGSNLHSPHPYQSHPIGWLLLARPVSYYYESIKVGQAGCHAAGGCVQEILGIGTPLLWWGMIPALAALIWLTVARRDWRAGLVLAGIAATFLPWMYYDVGRRTEFLFYALPAVPFMVIGMAQCAGLAIGGDRGSDRRRRWGTIGATTGVTLIVADFFWMFPILVGATIPYTFWHMHIWLPSWV